MCKKLADRKTNILSLAGRATLIQSVINFIPKYTMMTSTLLASLWDRIDKLNRYFIYMDTPKVHLVNWDTVCLDKN